MNDMKVKLTVEVSISAEECKDKGIDMQEIANSLVIEPSEVIDGFEIFPRHHELDICSDFMLKEEAKLISVEEIK